jgi:hypothetical protein
MGSSTIPSRATTDNTLRASSNNPGTQSLSVSPETLKSVGAVVTQLLTMIGSNRNMPDFQNRGAQANASQLFGELPSPRFGATPPTGGNGKAGRTGDTQAQGSTVIDAKPGDDIQALINQAQPGTVIRLAPGEYQNVSLKINKNITLDGSAGTVFNGNRQAKEAIQIEQGADGARIQDIDFQNYVDNGITAKKANQLTLHNLGMQDIGEYKGDKESGQSGNGIRLMDSSNSVISNTAMNNLTNKGIGVNGGKGNVVENNDVQNINKEAYYSAFWDTSGIKSFQSDNLTVRGNRVGNVGGDKTQNKGGAGIWIDTNGNGNVVDGNTFHGTTRNDVYIEKTANTRVTNNAKEDGDFLAQVSELSFEGLLFEGNAVQDTTPEVQGKTKYNELNRKAGGGLIAGKDFVFGDKTNVDPSKAGTFGFESPNTAANLNPHENAKKIDLTRVPGSVSAR